MPRTGRIHRSAARRSSGSTSTGIKGTADALYQNIYTIEKDATRRYVLILAGDHIYKMDYATWSACHIDNQADLTIGCIPVPLARGHQLRRDADRQTQRVSSSFRRSRPTPDPMPDDPKHCLASMGIYVFNAAPCSSCSARTRRVTDSDHDFGKRHHPGHDRHAPRVRPFRFRDRNRASSRYWRDVGTLDAYYQANMDLVDVEPHAEPVRRRWPIRTYQPQLPPPKFVFGDELRAADARRGDAHDSMVCQGSIISGGRFGASILSPNVRVNSYAVVEDSILFDGVDVGRHAGSAGPSSTRTSSCPRGPKSGTTLS